MKRVACDKCTLHLLATRAFSAPNCIVLPTSLNDNQLCGPNSVRKRPTPVAGAMSSEEGSGPSPSGPSLEAADALGNGGVADDGSAVSAAVGDGKASKRRRPSIVWTGKKVWRHALIGKEILPDGTLTRTHILLGMRLEDIKRRTSEKQEPWH